MASGFTKIKIFGLSLFLMFTSISFSLCLERSKTAAPLHCSFWQQYTGCDSSLFNIITLYQLVYDWGLSNRVSVFSRQWYMSNCVINFITQTCADFSFQPTRTRLRGETTSIDCLRVRVRVGCSDRPGSAFQPHAFVTLSQLAFFLFHRWLANK